MLFLTFAQEAGRNTEAEISSHTSILSFTTQRKLGFSQTCVPNPCLSNHRGDVREEMLLDFKAKPQGEKKGRCVKWVVSVKKK